LDGKLQQILQFVVKTTR